MSAASRTESSPSTDSESGPAPDLDPSPSAHFSGRDHSNTRDALECRTTEIGRDLFKRMGRGPKPWHRAWWENLFIGATLDDPLVRVQLFRFIDALPALHNDQAVRRHLAEYLAEAGDRVPGWL